MVIDFHTHTFPQRIAPVAIAQLKQNSGTHNFTNGTERSLTRSLKGADINLAVILPVVTNPHSADKINTASAEINQKTARTGLLSLGGIHPDTEHPEEILRRAAELGLRGIKLHPAYQQLAFSDKRYKNIIYLASALGLTVVTHGGLDIGVAGSYCTPDMIREVLHDVAPPRLVIAHMGGWRLWEEVAEKLAGAPVYFDTAFAAGHIAYTRSIPKNERVSLLTPEQLAALIQAHGADKILFGTDSPWCSQREALALIRALPLTDEQKERILWKNAANLLALPPEMIPHLQH